MHQSFLPLFIISLLGVLGAAFSTYIDSTYINYQWLSLASGLIPLAAYHIILGRKPILSPAVVDSVYYFGFLVTVITLVATAISIGIQPPTTKLNTKWVLLQFGLGLIATGYALFARLQLMSKSSDEVEMDVVDSTRELALSVSKVSGEFDRASYEVSAFVEQIHERLEKLILTTEQRFQDSLTRSLNVYSTTIDDSAQKALLKTGELIEKATVEFSTAVSGVMEEIGRVQEEARAISFEAASVKLTEFSKAIELSFVSITDKVLEASQNSAESISELNSTLRKVTKLSTEIGSKLESLNKIQDLLAAFENTTISLELFIDGVNSTITPLNSMRIHADKAAESFEAKLIVPLNDIGNDLIKNTQNLPDQSTQLSKTLKKVNETTENFNTLLESNIKTVGKSLLEINENLTASPDFKTLFNSASLVSESLNDLNTTLSNLKVELLNKSNT